MMKYSDPRTFTNVDLATCDSCGNLVSAEIVDGPTAGAGQCDRMCDECTNTCTRDWGHSGPHRCDTHWRG
ncbi:hypothetical protein [Notoacmeibacter sp. MSK16QG-6]|uniref:hypothetical protein n=1 Tax=Notoacmeibacter sp. MSK16QG-6 TaxID=2957982 RepID=UPI0020A0F025|nr:hypothetical protein [Notoacmeibacter sp. MSK16QG-6]MCP1198422.1 hypothetical protein [Notoacmeibacter sp. MSK16QG-6]